MSRRRGGAGRAATASWSSGRMRLFTGPLEIKSAPVGRNRPVLRPHSLCPKCDRHHRSGSRGLVPDCKATLMNDRGDL